MSFDKAKHDLWLINQAAVRLGILSQEDADLCTKNDKSLQYRIDAHNEKLANPEKYESRYTELRKAMWEP